MDQDALKLNKRAVAIIQARMSSSRFPGKVLEFLEGVPMIVFMVERVRRCVRIDRLIVATSTDHSDDPLAEVLAAHGVDCYRGSLEDVLDRFCGAALHFDARWVVRLTGDCPLMDPDLVDRALELLQTSGADYVSNISPPTFPDGLDVEAFTIEALLKARELALTRFEREHVTPFLRDPLNGFNILGFVACADFSAHRWTVDHPDDLEYVKVLLGSISSSSRSDRFDIYRSLESGRVSSPLRHARNEGCPPPEETGVQLIKTETTPTL
jgi:spore coat polysaccharide biosynthesis protein SpsF (cytidylyltransferase family)